jgi:DNA-binding GntR family transcriptional regulator
VKLSRDRPETLYEQIQEWMRKQIETGAWPEHYKLTAEDELSQRLTVNRGTLRKAIGGLIDEGLLVRVHGKGTFVASKHLEQPLAESFVTFSEGLIGRSIPFRTSVIVSNLRKPDPVSASLLSLKAADDAFYMERVRYVDERPIILLHNTVVHSFCRGIEELDFSQERLFDVLENRYSLSIDWGQRNFEARAADRDVSARISLQVGDPVMYLQQVSYLENGTPIELSDIWIRGDAFRLSAQVKRNRVAGDLREVLVGLMEGD